MAELTKYESFEAMKASEQPSGKLSADDKHRLAEFEQFLAMLRAEFLKQEALNVNNGRSSDR